MQVRHLMIISENEFIILFVPCHFVKFQSEVMLTPDDFNQAVNKAQTILGLLLA